MFCINRDRQLNNLPVPDRGNGVRYDYFLLNDTDMRVDHTWEKVDYPKAISAKYRFMHVVQDSYEQGDYIYFSNAEDNNKLYKLHKVTGETQRVADVRALLSSWNRRVVDGRIRAKYPRLYRYGLP